MSITDLHARSRRRITGHELSDRLLSALTTTAATAALSVGAPVGSRRAATVARR